MILVLSVPLDLIARTVVQTHAGQADRQRA